MLKLRSLGGPLRLLAVASLVVLGLAGPTRAQSVPFGTFVQAGPGRPFSFTGDTSTTSASFVATSTPVTFMFYVNTAFAPAFTAIQANLELSGTLAAKATPAGVGLITQNIDQFSSFKITDSMNRTILGASPFTGAITGVANATTVNLTSKQPEGNTLQFFSDYSPGVSLVLQDSVTFVLSSLTTPLSINPTTGFLNNFSSGISGTFSAVVPEPASVALMGLGLAGIPTAHILRRRRKAASRAV